MSQLYTIMYISFILERARSGYLSYNKLYGTTVCSANPFTVARKQKYILGMGEST